MTKDDFIEMRKQSIEFIERTIEKKWKKHMASDIVDILLTQYFLPYKEKVIKETKE